MATRRILPIIVVGMLVWPWSSARAGESDSPVPQPKVSADKVEKAPPDAQAPVGHLEVPHDAYVPVPRGLQPTSPPALVSRDGYVSVQVNVDAGGDNIVGDAANEPSIAVDLNNPSRMAIGWRQFDTISSDFRQAGWGYTADGGQTWTFPGVLDPGVFRSDPVLDSDADGNFYYNSLTADHPSLTYFICHVFKSTDGGATWGPGVYAFGGDKQWMTIDRTDGIGRNNIYAYWTRFYTCPGCNGHFCVSYDEGQSFTNLMDVPGNPQWGTLAVGPAGELYVAGDGFVVAKSTTMQDETLPPAFDFSTTVSLDGSMSYSGGPNPGGLLGQVWVAVDHSGGPSHGYVYLLCSVNRYSTSDPLDVMFARSTDGGQTWSAPVRVNDDPGDDAYQWFGTMSVAPNGRIDVIWLDTRNDPGGYDSELYYSYSEDAGVTWSTNAALSPSFDPHVGWPQQNKMGDYFDMVSDDFGAHLAYAGTFNGEQDVYYLRIGDPACPDAGIVRLDRPKYACESTAGMTVLDCGLNADDQVAETVAVTIDSDSEPAGETVVLTESGPSTAYFQGSVALSETDAAGVLHVAEGDTVTVTYIDADDGEGGINVPVTDTAVVDCTEPQISNVQSSDPGPFGVTVTFDTNEPTTGTVHYGASCGALNESTSRGGVNTSHSITLTGLSEDSTYYYAVEAEDEAGNTGTDDNGGLCYMFQTTDIPLYFTEQFSSGFDLQDSTLVFTLSGTVDFYDGCVEPITEFPTDPTGGTAITSWQGSTDDGYAEVTLGGQIVSLYGVDYGSFWVGTNGYITFGAGDSDYTETLGEHFDTPRISAVFDDLSPQNGGGVSYKILADRVAVTYDDVPEYSSTGSNNFQIEMFFDGTIVISYLSCTVSDCIVGLSEGTGQPPAFYEMDLSAMGNCGPKPPQAYGAALESPPNLPVAIQLQASDDGLPDPPAALDYIITALPADGSLTDPGAGLVSVVPYALVDGGNEVVYMPSLNYVGPDSFTFKVNDGGIPPEGGDSNVATVSLMIGGPSPLYQFWMDADPGWSCEGQWAFGVPTGGGSHDGDPAGGHTGDNVYGYNLAGDYTNNMPEYFLTVGPLDCTDATDVELRFWRWLGVEWPFDHAHVAVSNNGRDWFTVWDTSAATVSDSSWTEMLLDVSAVADDQPTVYVRWCMGTTDGSTTYPGWNIDDVELWGLLPLAHVPGDMDGDGDVDLNDFATFANCFYGSTITVPPPGCTPDQFAACDMDADGDVDLSDFSTFALNFTG